MTVQIITGEKFEEARAAYKAAWLRVDLAQLEGLPQVPGARSTAGLKAALLVLGTKVEDS